MTQSRNAKTMTTSHLYVFTELKRSTKRLTQLTLRCLACFRAHRKQCIELEQQFDFLKDLVAAVPDMQGEGEENHTEVVGEKVSRRYACLC